MTEKVTGGCHCGSVQYESEAPEVYGHCHCITCQKTHSSAFATTGRVSKDSFKWLKGEDLITAYESSAGKFRNFCSKCGCHMMAEYPAYKDFVILRISSLDKPLAKHAGGHIWMSHQAWFFEFNDNLPKADEGSS